MRHQRGKHVSDLIETFFAKLHLGIFTVRIVNANLCREGIVIGDDVETSVAALDVFCCHCLSLHYFGYLLLCNIIRANG
jgi:hypothetical protein